jgi:antitoxin component of RelBE/YafQ-DinJ toxin-antitoxin module
MTYQLHLAIADHLKEDLQAYADAYGVTIAAATRILLRQGLEREAARMQALNGSQKS